MGIDLEEASIFLVLLFILFSVLSLLYHSASDHEKFSSYVILSVIIVTGVLLIVGLIRTFLEVFAT